MAQNQWYRVEKKLLFFTVIKIRYQTDIKQDSPPNHSIFLHHLRHWGDLNQNIILACRIFLHEKLDFNLDNQ